ncbi:MAG: type II toxin-antitoxin system HicB family antitoxin [Oscillospiraceae bacterium]|nr:type II toxin-antitoxin system HicB family antitoxin [Oscillospiraceae bacterium]
MQPCYTEGKTLEEAVIMAHDALKSRIEVALEQKEELPVPSDIDSLQGDRIMLIIADIEDMKTQTRYIKKTLSIPRWLNEAAENAYLNFSRIL